MTFQEIFFLQVSQIKISFIWNIDKLDPELLKCEI